MTEEIVTRKKPNGDKKLKPDQIDKLIINYLLEHGESKLLEIADKLDIDHSTIHYHLNKLIEKGIVLSRGRYPAKYRINYKLIDPKKEFLQSITVTILWIFSIILLTQGRLIESILTALTGLTISLPTTWRIFIDKYIHKVEKLLS